ncbi:competence transcription factor ComK [Bacilli bacterium PM5-3]|nr:competence transcription factor ComK [Bacilli bacterium PM5-3]MDH6603441.1 competence transcription factor ComK [Bacilli bacterium PM5-9]
MFNVIYNFDDKLFIQKEGEDLSINHVMDTYLDKLCLLSGTTLKGSINASKKLLPKTRKVPIYVACIDDYIIPLASPLSNDCIWISANNYLTCYELNNKTYIKFKDRSIYEVAFSTFTIRMQYKKYLKLERARKEMKYEYIVRKNK